MNPRRTISKFLLLFIYPTLNIIFYIQESILLIQLLDVVNPFPAKQLHL